MRASHPRRLIVAVDGPAGAGKSTTSRELARRLGYRYVDSGAMYRAIGLLAEEKGVPLQDEGALAALCRSLTFAVDEQGPGGAPRLLVGGRDMTEAVRSPRAGELASVVSTHPAVRARLRELQRALGVGGGLVMEGRDIGTVVFPEADVKLYLTAAPAERARRRQRELAERGIHLDLRAVEKEIAVRDRRDRSRRVAPLRPAPGAVVLDTTKMRFEEAVAAMEQVVRERQAESQSNER